ncbi:glycoside hydrolase family 6 protein [Marinicellulosiphila megalodicopiae]|uniref:glycoside hydrolase family 6 protein n=1 Tax=Marinicellulosiphila megalodicopiae TaxID=2724896 RepID=UPI003BAEFD51
MNAKHPINRNTSPAFKLSALSFFILAAVSCTSANDENSQADDSTISITETQTGTETQTATETITENTLPEIEVLGTPASLTGTAPFTVMLDASNTTDADMDELSFSWDQYEDGSIESTDIKTALTFNEVGTHSVKLTVSDSTGVKTEIISVNVTDPAVDNPPVADIRVIGSLTGEGSVMAILDASDSSDDQPDHTYAWAVDGVDIANDTHSFSQIFSVIGSYEITLTVTDSIGQTDQVTKTVTVQQQRINGAPMADLSGTGPIVGRAPLTVLFKSSHSTDDDGIASISWDFGDGSTSMEANPKYEYQANGTYTATLTITDTDGLTDVKTIDITLLNQVISGEPPVAHILTSTARGEIPLSVTFDGSASMAQGNIVSYEWDFGNGSFKYGPVVNHVFTQGLENKIYLRVTDDKGLSHETFTEVVSVLTVPTGKIGEPMQTDNNPFEHSAFYVSPDIKVLQDESLQKIDKDTQPSLYNDIQFVQQMPSAVWLDRTVAIYGGDLNDGRRPLSKFIAGDNNTLEGHLDEAAAQQDALAVEGIKPPMTAVIIVYNLPDRDCAALASNGQLNETKDGPDADSLPDGTGLELYKTEYIDVIKQAFALYPDIRIVAMLEPDGYPNMITNIDPFVTATDDCNAVNEAGVYKDGLQYAINAFHDMPNVYTYIDIGHSGWLGWDSLDTDNLQRSVIGFTDLVAGATESGDLGAIRGFASNTSGYTPLQEPYVSSEHSARQNLVPFYEWNRHVDELSFIDTMYKRFTIGDVAKGDGSTVRVIEGQGFPENLGFIIDTARNGWGGPNRPSGEGAPIQKDDAAYRIDTRVHRGHWCNVNNAGIGEIPQAAPDATRPYLDAYFWMKPPGESDGISSLTDGANDEGKSYDPMCGGEASNSTGIAANVIQGAPHAGHWFHEQFIMLIENAYPPLGVKAPQGGSDAASFVDDFNSYNVAGTPQGIWTEELKGEASLEVVDDVYYGLVGNAVKFSAAEQDRNNDMIATINLAEEDIESTATNQYGRVRINGIDTGEYEEAQWNFLTFKGSKSSRQWWNMQWGIGGYEGYLSASVTVANGNGAAECQLVSSTPIPKDEWACVEWHMDVNNNTLSIWSDGELVEDLLIDINSPGCSSESWIAPDSITGVSLGLARYRPTNSQQVVPETEPKPDVSVIMDDFAIGGSRLGCNNVRTQ